MLAQIFLLIQLVSPSCFIPNGTDRNSVYNSSDESAAYLPCHTSSDGRASMCCRSGDANPDVCRPDGLCENPGGWFWRESCTDNTWKAKGCVKLCIDGSMANGDVKLKLCEDGSWCCDVTVEGSDERAGEQCCSRGQGKWVDEHGEVMDMKPASAASSTVASTLSSSRTGVGTSSASSPTAASTTSNNTNTGEIVGGVVGAFGGGLIIAAAGFFFYRSRKARKAPEGSQSMEMEDTLVSHPAVEAPVRHSRTVHELPGPGNRASH